MSTGGPPFWGGQFSGGLREIINFGLYGGGLRGAVFCSTGGATGYNFALTCPNIAKNCSARLFKSLQREMMQYYAITLPRQVSKKVLGGATFFGGEGQLFRGGATILPFRGGKGGFVRF